MHEAQPCLICLGCTLLFIAEKNWPQFSNIQNEVTEAECMKHCDGAVVEESKSNLRSCIEIENKHWICRNGVNTIQRSTQVVTVAETDRRISKNGLWSANLKCSPSFNLKQHLNLWSCYQLEGLGYTLCPLSNVHSQGQQIHSRALQTYGTDFRL